VKQEPIVEIARPGAGGITPSAPVPASGPHAAVSAVPATAVPAPPREGPVPQRERPAPPRERPVPLPDAALVHGTSTFRVSEVFHSLQGEGPAAGTPAHFVRLQGCDVGCRWCDTKYSWDARGGEALASGALWARARALGSSDLLVVTGGEPLQHPRIAELLAEGLDRWLRVEVETSGLEPPPLRHPRLHWNVSPKLPSATPRSHDTWRHARAWSAEPNATFKIVVGDPPDPDDALRLIEAHGLAPARVMLMPEGMTEERLRARARTLAELCRRHGFRLSPRLHVWLWGARRGT
jgi:organic radical activating enzyme